MKLDLVKIQSGQMAPDLSMQTTGGGTARLSDYRNRENVILLFMGSDTKPGPSPLLKDLKERRADFEWEHTAIILVNPGRPVEFPGQTDGPFSTWIDEERAGYRLLFGDQPRGEMAYLVLDRFGEVVQFGPLSGPEGPVDAQELLEIVAFVELQCPE